MKALIGTIVLAVLAGCTLPATEVRTGAARPSLAVHGAPAGATLYLDGVLIGAASAYDGKAQKLMIEEGVHRVDVKQAGAVLVSRQILAAAGELTTVTVTGEETK